MRMLYKAAFASIIVPIAYCTVQKRNKLFAFGSNNCGQIGTGDQTNKTIPTQVEGDFIYIDARKNVSAAINTQGQILTWGKSKCGILGHSLQRNVNLSLPAKINCNKVKFVQISIGYTHMGAITQDGELYVWGSGQIYPIHKEKSKVDMRNNNYVQLNSKGLLPSKVQLKSKVRNVACGQDHTLVLTEQGQILSWGSGKALGILNHSGNMQKLNGLPPIIKIKSGPDFSLALSVEKKLYGWGNNAFSQLGISQSQFIAQPIQLNLKNVVDFSCGQNFAMAITGDGQIYSWGKGGQGQLGHSDKADSTIPKKLKVQFKAKKVSCGGQHAAFIDQQGKVYVVGRGKQGQLGIVKKDQTNIIRTNPQLLQGVNAKQIACGGQHTLFLKQ